jgi:hypothetical protein
MLLHVPKLNNSKKLPKENQPPPKQRLQAQVLKPNPPLPQSKK